MLSINEIIDINLFEFYRLCARCGNFPLIDESFGAWVDAPGITFPNKLFAIPTAISEHQTRLLIQNIEDAKAPSTLIYNNKQVPDDFEARLEAANLRKVMQWYGMALDLQKFRPQIQPNKDIRLLKNSEQTAEWIQVLSAGLFDSKPLHIQMFTRVVNDSSVRAYLLLDDGKPATTLLSFYQGDVCGLYMLSTLSEFRKRGHAEALFQRVLADAQKAGMRWVTLQATQMGYGLYKKLGFATEGMYHIHWMLGRV